MEETKQVEIWNNVTEEYSQNFTEEEQKIESEYTLGSDSSI